MKPKKIALKAGEKHRGMRLDHMLATELPAVLGREISKAKVRMLVVAGAVYLNSTRVRIASKALLPGARVDVYVDEAKLFSTQGPARDRAFEMSPAHILFEDEWIIVVNKPPGLPTQPTVDEARDNLFGALKKYLSQREGREAYVGLHHRLDRDTSGVILFTKKTEANAGVAKLFSDHLARKTYLCAVERVPGRRAPEASWQVKNFLRKDGTSKKSKMISVRSGGDSAITDFKLMRDLKRGWLIEASPLTGRMHQIRVHLSEAGLPISGDATYGRESSAPRLMLHAVRLTFPHPLTSLTTSVEAPLPEDFSAWVSKLDS